MLKSVWKLKKNMAKSHKTCMEQAEIIDTFGTYQLPSCDLFTSHSLFIVFWERDITSERHGTPVHISTTVYTFNLLSSFTFCCSHHYHYLLRLILCKQQGRRD